jgi:hypothetical protein
MGLGDFVKDAVKWIVANWGAEIVVLLKEALQHQWRRLFAARNILILGSKQTGKSSLMQYLSSGRPFEIVNGEVRPPAPTAMGVVIDQKFSLQKGSWLKLKKDLPGDPDLRTDLWAQAIADVRPHGIIYMADGRLADGALRAEVRAIRDLVLAHYPTGAGSLSALHVFVNYADLWAGTAEECRRRLRVVREELENVTGASPEWVPLRLGVAATQLSSGRKTWEETDRALQHFGADLLV